MKNDFFEYTMTRGEFAKSIGKTKEAVRSAMRRGQYSECYRFDGSQYLFKSPDRPRAGNGKSHPGNHGQMAMPKRKINRGNHYNAKYPNEAFRLYNQRKILEKLNKTDADFVKNIPELEKIHQQQMQKRIESKPTTVKNYGGMLTQAEMNRMDFEPSNRGPSTIKKYYY